MAKREPVLMRHSPAIVAAATVLTLSAPVAAEWNVTQYRDNKTSTLFNVATLADSGAQARLRMQCINGRMFTAIILANAVTPPDIVRLRATYKFDSARAVPRTAILVDKGRELWLWTDEPESTLQRIARSRRLLIELFPNPDDTVSLDFDLTGADRVVPQVRCPPVELTSPSEDPPLPRP
ncbi:MAG: hypothetical protein K2Y71_04345 [Xanthobacteraceae bacterium]|nr:hypothetical protein [Xanthobacteraceae bacterium]